MQEHVRLSRDVFKLLSRSPCFNSKGGPLCERCEIAFQCAGDMIGNVDASASVSFAKGENRGCALSSETHSRILHDLLFGVSCPTDSACKRLCL